MRTISNTEFAAHPEMYLDMAREHDVRIRRGDDVFHLTRETADAPPKSTWQQAVDDGAMTVDGFFDEVRRRQRQHYDSLEHA